MDPSNIDPDLFFDWSFDMGLCEPQPQQIPQTFPNQYFPGPAAGFPVTAYAGGQFDGAYSPPAVPQAPQSPLESSLESSLETSYPGSRQSSIPRKRSSNGTPQLLPKRDSVASAKGQVLLPNSRITAATRSSSVGSTLDGAGAMMARQRLQPRLLLLPR